MRRDKNIIITSFFFHSCLFKYLFYLTYRGTVKPNLSHEFALQLVEPML